MFRRGGTACNCPLQLGQLIVELNCPSGASRCGAPISTRQGWPGSKITSEGMVEHLIVQSAIELSDRPTRRAWCDVADAVRPTACFSSNVVVCLENAAASEAVPTENQSGHIHIYDAVLQAVALQRCCRGLGQCGKRAVTENYPDFSGFEEYGFGTLCALSALFQT